MLEELCEINSDIRNDLIDFAVRIVWLVLTVTKILFYELSMSLECKTRLMSNPCHDAAPWTSDNKSMFGESIETRDIVNS